MEASVTLGLDSSPFAAGIQQAEAKAAQFGSRVGKLMGGGGGRSPWDEFTRPIPEATRKIDGLAGRITNLFRRTPERRAETAISESIARLASGDITGGIATLTTRISGLGLAAGVGVGAAILIFTKLKGQIHETEEATKALNAELSKPLGSQSALGPEGIGQQIEATTKALDDLTKKRKTWGSQIEEAAIQGQPDFFNTTTLKTETPDRVPPSLKASQDATKRITELTEARVRAEEDLTSVKEASLHGDEQTAALAKLSLDITKQRADILLKARPKPGTIDPLGSAEAFKQAQEISKQGEIDKELIDRKFEQKKQEADVETRILQLKKSGLTTEEQTTQETRLRIALLRSQLGTANISDRQGIQNKITGLKSTLGPDNRPPIGIEGEQPLGIFDPNLGEFRTQLRPQEQANLRGGQLEAAAQLGLDQLKYQNDVNANDRARANYLAGSDAYSPDQLRKPIQPAGYDIDLTTGRVKPRDAGSGNRAEKPMTKEEFQQALDAVFGKYWN